MEPEALAPNPVRASDIATLIGVLAVLEGELMAAALQQQVRPGDSVHELDRYRARFELTGLVTPGADEREFRQAINDMNFRLRYTLGERPDPSPAGPVP